MKRGWGKTALLFVALCLIEALAASGEAFALDSGRCVLNARDPPAQPAHYAAKVQGPASPDEVKRQTKIAEIHTGGTVSPDYVAYPRVIAFFIVNGVSHSTIAAVVDGDIPKPGEIVDLASRYRDPRDPCRFIPWTVSRAGQKA